MLSLVAVALSLTQTPVAGAASYHTAACNAAKLSGFLPFKVSFTCAPVAGTTGCSTSGTVSFDHWNGYEYPRFCQLTQYGQLPTLLDVGTILSGVEISTEGPMDHNELSVDFRRVAFDPASHSLDWEVTVLWADRPGIGVDKFEAAVHGMFVFTAQNEIVLMERSFACQSPGEYCSNTRFVNQGTKTWGGVAFNRLILRAPSGILGPGNPPLLYPGPTFLSAELGEAPFGSGQNVTFSCGVGGAFNVDCRARAMVVMGENGFVEPFQYQHPIYSSAWNAAVGFSATTGAKAAMSCGVRHFYVQGDISPLINHRYQSLWFGQTSTDCGWTPGDKYTGLFLFGWENPYASPPFYLQVNRADGTRLP